MTAPSLHPTSSPPTSSSKPSNSPPFADTVIRPFTSQGSSFSPSPSPLTFSYPSPPALSSPPPAPAPTQDDDDQLDPPPPQSRLGPYMSASARTSYTRVDVDSLAAPVYPPLPSLPSASTDPNPPHNDNDIEPPSTHPAQTIPSTTTDSSQHNVASATALAESSSIPQTPQVSLTFLLVSGRRKTQSFDPETTVGRVKELVWNAWPGRDADWQDERPPAPSYLRILYLGRILQDDETLVHIGFPTTLPSTSTPNQTIVHLSIRPYALPSEDPALNKKKRLSVAIGRRNSSNQGEGAPEEEGEGAGCCNGCVIC